MATTRNRKKQRLDQDLVRYQAALADAQARYDSVAAPKRKQYDLDVAAHQDTVARMRSDYESQLQAYSVRVSEYQSAQQANAAQRQAALDAYQIEMQDFTRRRSDHEAEVLRMMESYGAQLTAQQTAYANQMEDYNRAYDQYQQGLRAYDQWEEGYLRDLQGRPLQFTGVRTPSGQLQLSLNGPINVVRSQSDAMYVSNDLAYSMTNMGRGARALDVTLNDEAQFVETSSMYLPAGRGGPAHYNVTGYVKQRLPDGSFVDQMPDAYTTTTRPTFSAQAPTRPALTNFPVLPEAPVAPTSPRLPALELQMPSAPTMAALPPAPSLPDFSVEDGVLKEETARETELFDRRVAERKAGRRRARSSGGTRPMISAEQLRAAQQPSLSEGQSLGGTGFLGSN